jgi:hypothetical protein
MRRKLQGVQMKIHQLVVGLLIGTTAICVGCEVKRTSNQPAPATAGKADSHDHDHDHDHPEHGPNGGHIAHFDTNPTTHFEWAHDDEKHTLTVYFEELVSGGAKIDSVEVRVTSEGSEKKFPLQSDDKAKVSGSVFTATDAELLTLVGASGDDPKGVQAKLIAVIDGKEESILLKDDHHHH